MSVDGRTGLLLDPVYGKHDTGWGHPESSARIRAITERLRREGQVEKLEPIAVRAARRGEILRAHHEDYFELARAEIEAGARELSTGDTVVCEDSFEVAMKAAGGVLNAVDAVMGGELARAFCAVRPPGHHATPDRGMGFCVFNNVAVAARHAQRAHGVERVVIADWDVHHGNGTQDIFYEDGTVFYFSTHQHPWYPGTGAALECGRGEGAGTTLNVPQAAGSGMREIGGAFRGPFSDAMAAFRPELVLISAGFDSGAGDPLGHLMLRDEDFAELTRVMTGIADEYAEGRLVSVLEGGYALEGLASAVSAHVKALAGDR